MRPRLPAALVSRVALAAAFVCGAYGCDKPPNAEVSEWTAADHDGEKAASPTRGPRLAGSAAAGGADPLVQATWNSQCATCHGSEGRGDGPQGPMFKAPDLTQSTADEATMLTTIREGKGKMPRFELPDEVARGLVAHVRALRGR